MSFVQRFRKVDLGLMQSNTHKDIAVIENMIGELGRRVISDVFKTDITRIKNIKEIKTGMTNRSFLFEYGGEKYIIRIPGEGTGEIINRSCEAAIYDLINNKGICDDVVYFDYASGCKIAKYIESARNCNPYIEDDLKKCMKKLKAMHSMNLKVENEFDIFSKVIEYEKLWKKEQSKYSDYIEIKEKVFSLKKYINCYNGTRCLTHIDAVSDNFLMTDNEGVRLIDWEYAGMQDPHVDIAMFCIYANYNKEQIDRLIDIYFENNCVYEIRLKIYCYISVCGLLWSNWCEYKEGFGIEFGDYALYQYQYAKDYYLIVAEELGNE